MEFNYKLKHTTINIKDNYTKAQFYNLRLSKYSYAKKNWKRKSDIFYVK